MNASVKMDMHSELMNTAYARWQANKEWSKEQFLDQLSPIEKFAVATGNLNYQVENGGFMQWWSNDYGTPATVDYLLRTLGMLDVPEDHAVNVVINLLDEFKGITKGKREADFGNNEIDAAYEELNPLDSAYYECNGQFMEFIEQHLQAIAPKEEATTRDIALAVVIDGKCTSITLHTSRENAQQAAQAFSTAGISWTTGALGELLGKSADISFHIRHCA